MSNQALSCILDSELTPAQRIWFPKADLLKSTEDKVSHLHTLLCTAFALVAFAANSILCRLALYGVSIDAASFSLVRLISGSATLLLIKVLVRKSRLTGFHWNWLSAIALFLYAVGFSFAYVNLSAGTGALILFGTVQATMILAGIHSGEQPRLLDWMGLSLALVGLIYLALPGLTAPSLTGCVLMAIAGVSWGFYSLRGRNAVDPLAETTSNFILTSPFALLVSLIALNDIHISAGGFLLASLSGSLASGVGYVAWYAALRGLTATRAATVQLSVPVLAAIGGAVFLSEQISLRLMLSSVMILGGIGLTLTGRRRLTGFLKKGVGHSPH